MEFKDIIKAINIEPYYLDADSGIVIYCADCRQILPLIPNKSIDLVLTDFPYGNETDYGIYEDTQENLQKLIGDSLPQFNRITNLYAFTTGIGNMFKYPSADWVFSWFTGMDTQLSTRFGFNCWQPILIYGKDPYLARCLGRHSDVILQDRDKNPNYKISHPCPKSLGSWSRLIIRLTPEINSIILDPFLGSGTTLVAAKKLGIKAIGIEISEKYYAIAVERLRQSIMSLDIPLIDNNIKQEPLL